MAPLFKISLVSLVALAILAIRGLAKSHLIPIELSGTWLADDYKYDATSSWRSESVNGFQKSLLNTSSNFYDTARLRLEGNLPHRLAQNNVVFLRINRAKHLLANRLIKVLYDQDGRSIIEKPGIRERSFVRCMFTGYVEGEIQASVSVNMCNGLAGTIRKGNNEFHLHNTNTAGVLTHSFEVVQSNRSARIFKCGTRQPSHKRRHKRQSVNFNKNFGIEARFIEVALVISKGFSAEMRGAGITPINRAYEVVNIASNLIQQLGAYVVIVAIEDWSYGNHINLPTTDPFYSAGLALTAFKQYVKQRMIGQIPHDLAILLVGGDETHGFDGIVGKSIQDSICRSWGSVVLIEDSPDSTAHATATFLAHELGHSLGLSHDHQYELHDDTYPYPCKSECNDAYSGKPDDGSSSCVMAAHIDTGMLIQRWSFSWEVQI